MSFSATEVSELRQQEALLAALRPIEALLLDEQVIEIMLNPDGKVWTERARLGMSLTDIYFAPQDAERMLRHIAASLSLQLNQKVPTLSCKLPFFGARVQGSIPPIVKAPAFNLRMPARLIYSLEDYVAQGVLSDEQARALADAVRARQNVLISGGTGSGKTTFANAILQVVARTGDRVLLVEDTPELQCEAPNKTEFFLNADYECRDAIKAAMRCRPDRIIVGEIRDGGSALELIKAWNTGHPGGVATVHANSTRATLLRVCQLCEEVVTTMAKEVVAETINVCVHLQRDPTARAGRSLTGLDRVVGYSAAEGFLLEPLL